LLGRRRSRYGSRARDRASFARAEPSLFLLARETARFDVLLARGTARFDRQ
jgi:hypothetical protein